MAAYVAEYEGEFFKPPIDENVVQFLAIGGSMSVELMVPQETVAIVLHVEYNTLKEI